MTAHNVPSWVQDLAVIGLDLNDVPLIDAALIYAELHIPVFPLQPNSKIPYAKSRGVLAATTDRQLIECFWLENPTSNIGIATGTAFAVLDVDTKHDAPGWASVERVNRNGLLSGAWAHAQTPSLGGHLCFAANNEGNHTAGKAGHGLDFRGVGGYIVAAPSHLSDGKYEWVGFATERYGMPFHWEAATALLVPQRGAVPKELSGSTDANRLIKVVSEAKEGNRNAALYWAAMRCVESGIDPTVLEDAARLIGLEQRELEGTIRSAMTAGAR